MRALVLAAAACACVLGLSILATGCGGPASGGSIPPAARPAVADATSAQSAVRSYLDWISYAYRVADSEVASHTMTAQEWARVDSYVELNRRQDQGIEQRLLSLEVRETSVESSTARLAASEDWEYRYFDLGDGEYVTDAVTVSYDTTYTLVGGDGAWLVDHVDVHVREQAD